MLNGFAKFLLISTALSPILGAVAVNQYALGKPMEAWLPWVAVGLLLALICWLLLRHTATNAQVHQLKLVKFESNDKDVLAFLLAYLLPFVSGKDMLADLHWMVCAYVLALILLIFTHARAYHFNPVLGLLGYHFYSLQDGDEASVLLISRAVLCKAGVERKTVRLAHNIYLDIEGA